MTLYIRTLYLLNKVNHKCIMNPFIKSSPIYPSTATTCANTHQPTSQQHHFFIIHPPRHTHTSFFPPSADHPSTTTLHILLHPPPIHHYPAILHLSQSLTHPTLATTIHRSPIHFPPIHPPILLITHPSSILPYKASTITSPLHASSTSYDLFITSHIKSTCDGDGRKTNNKNNNKNNNNDRKK